MYYGVQFGDFHSYKDWGLYLNEPPEISPPEPQTYYVDVPGRNGALDLTETLTGGVAYNDRTIGFKFLTVRPRSEWPALYHEILNDIHGKSMQIVLDEDPDYYYEGRAVVDSWNPSMTDRMEFPEIVATVRPFKWEFDEVEVSETFTDISGSYLINANGENVAKQSWNVDYRYGTEEIPTFDFSTYKAIYIEGTMYNGNAWTNLQFVSCTDGVKAVYNVDLDYGKGEHFEIYITITTLQNAGIDPSTLYRILLSGASYAQVYVETQDTVVLTVEGSARNSTPVIEVTSGISSVTLDGKSYELDAGPNLVEGLQLHQGENDLMFSGSFSSATISISYRRGWL